MLLTAPKIPSVLCQSTCRQQTKVYILTISRYLDARLTQVQWLDDNGYSRLGDCGPAVDVSYLVRYLFLEMPNQRKKLLPLLKDESKSEMNNILNRYKRTYKRKLHLQPGQILKGRRSNEDLIITIG